MKFYIIVMLAIAGGVLFCVFYRFSYKNGYQACQSENQKKIISAFQREEVSRRKALEQKQTLNIQLERKKENDQKCSDVLNFDVRHCLSAK